jgi:DNA-binding XRE family transcriptional regulator
MAFDYSKLRGKIREVFNTQDEFAKAIGLSNTSISAKLNNKVEWSQQEINKAAEVLRIPDNEIYVYFFAEKV